MNYYERHLGDYARDTAHLSMLEHGAYGLLLDRYYSTEAGIPEDQAHRLARARTRDERAAVDAVLGEFFRLQEGLWVNGRAEREVARTQTKIKAARENGKAGGRPRKNPETTEEKPSGLLLGSDSVTQHESKPNPLQSPDTRQEQKGATVVIPPQQARAPIDAEPPPEFGSQPPTAAGLVCRAMRQVGLQSVNHGDPRLSALLAQGVTEAEFVGVAIEAVAGGKGWAWVLHVVAARRAEAAAIAIAPGGAPPQRGLAAPNTTVPSAAAERTQDMLREQSAKRQDRPSAEVLARIAAIKRVAA